MALNQIGDIYQRNKMVAGLQANEVPSLAPHYVSFFLIRIENNTAKTSKNMYTTIASLN